MTPFNNQAEGYLCNLPPEFLVAGGVETHKPCQYVKDIMDKNVFKAHANDLSPSTNSERGTHGGEFIATRSHLDSNFIEQEVWDAISEATFSPLRVSAKYFRAKGVTYIVAVLYLWCSAGLSERSNLLLLQAHLLSKIVGYPIILYGDFNIHADVLRQSGWLEYLGVDLFQPKTHTTITTADASLIDYVLVSKSLSPLILNISRTWEVPWGPHAGLILEVVSRPRIVQALVQCKPKELPYAAFQKAWLLLPEARQAKACLEAEDRAKAKLAQQRRCTGVAILGRPLDVLEHDIKFQGVAKQDAIAAGELMAQAALTCEYLICDIARIPQQDQYKYIGRSNILSSNISH